jgi:hypothetical protein
MYHVPLFHGGGIGEGTGDMIGDGLESLGVPTTIQITDKKGNFAPNLTTRQQLKQK